jgi:hypothetical protein
MMSYPEVISDETSFDLRLAAARYGATIARPCYLDGVDGFAKAYLPVMPDTVSTLVTYSPTDALTISSRDNNDNPLFRVHVDMVVPGVEIATIVNPDFYDFSGRRKTDRKSLARAIVRPLFENEGLSLISDLMYLTHTTPSDRRKS